MAKFIGGAGGRSIALRITGTYADGETLTASWQGEAPGSATYQWQGFNGSTWANISGATNSTYVQSGAPSYEDIRCLGTPTLAARTSNEIAAPVVATVPDAFIDANWSVATGAGANQITVTIASLPNNGGATITDVEYDIDASGSWASLPTYSGTGDYILTMAAPGVSYAIRLRAVNSVGNATAGNSESATSKSTVPGQFGTGDWSISSGDTEANVTISGLPSTGGSTILDIEYQVDGGSWVSSGGTTDFDITSLTNDVEIDVAIRAVNANGAGTASATKAVTPTSVAFTLDYDPADLGGGSAAVVANGSDWDIVITGGDYAGTYGTYTTAELESDEVITLVEPTDATVSLPNAVILEGLHVSSGTLETTMVWKRAGDIIAGETTNAYTLVSPDDDYMEITYEETPSTTEQGAHPSAPYVVTVQPGFAEDAVAFGATTNITAGAQMFGGTGQNKLIVFMSYISVANTGFPLWASWELYARNGGTSDERHQLYVGASGPRPANTATSGTRVNILGCYDVGGTASLCLKYGNSSVVTATSDWSAASAVVINSNFALGSKFDSTSYFGGQMVRAAIFAPATVPNATSSTVQSNFFQSDGTLVDPRISEDAYGTPYFDWYIGTSNNAGALDLTDLQGGAHHGTWAQALTLNGTLS